MKLFSSYNHTFTASKTLSFDIWNLVKNEPSLNGLYVCDSSYLETSLIGVNNTTQFKVKTWFNMIENGNYLYTATNKEPILTLNDSQFNGNPSIDFSDSTLQQLLFRYPINVGTLIIVYLTRSNDSYLIYAPRAILGSSGTPDIYYDGFPRSGNQLWSRCIRSDDSIYDAESRINGRSVLPTQAIPLNTARILTVKNIANTDKVESILGFGGKTGIPNGTTTYNLTASVQGKIAAIITFEDDIPLSTVEDIEFELGRIYINYTGVTLTSTPSFKALVGTVFSFDFSTIVLDEWFDITAYELITPLDQGLSFVGSTLSGLVTEIYEGTLEIRVTNSASMVKTFSFDLIFCRKDPIVDSLPQLAELNLVLSASKNIADGSYYGVVKDMFNKVLAWEDARRIDVPLLETIEGTEPFLVEGIINDQPVIEFGSSSSIRSDNPLTGKTFVWVYQQLSYGTRKMLDTFPDIKGTGELWSVTTESEVHGSTPITKLTTKIQRINVNTLSYKLPLNTTYIITATQPDLQDISFNGFLAMRGYLAFFASWDVILTGSELNTVVSLLAQRYYASLAPYVFNTNPEYRYTSSITVDLKNKVSDLQGLTLSYNLLTPYYDSAVDSNGILTVTGDKDEILPYEIEVSNTIPLTSVLEFNLDIALKTNTLYLNLKTLGVVFNAFYITELDSITTSGSTITIWEDYRNNGNSLTSTNVSLTTLVQLENLYAADFAMDGSSYLEFTTPIVGQSFIIVYIRKQGSTGKAFLLGQDITAEFSSGSNGVLFDPGLTSSNILNTTTYVNGKEVSSSYLLTPEVVNILIVNSLTPLTVDSVAKDRVFTDRSFKGYTPLIIALDSPILDQLTVTTIEKMIRDYYDVPKFITLLHFDTLNVDSSIRNKTLTVKGSLNSSVKKFGASSFELIKSSVANYIYIPNEIDFAFLNEDFTISFWINGNQRLNEEVFSIYTQTGLSIFLYDNELHIGIGNSFLTSELTYTLANSFYNTSNTFHHIQVNRKEGMLYLFVDGIYITEIEWLNEFIDYNSPILIGQTINLTESVGTNYYLDELAIYKRSAFNTDTFTPPASPYTP